MNGSVVSLLFATFVCTMVAVQGETCKSQLQDVGACLEQKFKDNKEADLKKREEIKAKASKCFTDANCQAPDYDAEPKIGGRLKQQFDNTPAAVKDCLKNEAKKAGLEALNKCLKEKNVKTLEAGDDDDHDVFDEKLMGADKHVAEKMAKTFVNVGMALKKCKNDAGDEALKKVHDCMTPIHDEIKTFICTRVNDCKKEKLTDEACKKRTQEVKDAACLCKKDRIKESISKVEELQKRGGDVEISELKGLAAGHPEAGQFGQDMDKVEKCYRDNNTPVPPFFNLLKGGPQGGPPGLFAALKPKISQDQLQDIHDMLEIKLNEPCGCN